MSLRFPPRGAAAVCLACLLLSATPASAAANGTADAPERALKRSPQMQRSDLGVPGVGRIVLVFIVTVAVGVGAIVLLRRMPRKFLRRESASGAIQVLDRADLGASLRVQLVQVEGRRIVIAEGKGGVGLAVLPEP